METLVHDVRDAVRSLSRSPAFAVVAILTLAAGIGANTAIFSAIQAVLLRPLPYPEPERVVFIQERRPASERGNSVSPLNYLDWKSQTGVFDSMAAATSAFASITGLDAPVQVSAMHVTGDYFNVFGLRAMLGRTFGPSDQGSIETRVAILSHRLWVSRFASDVTIVGRSLRVDGEIYTVIGVMPASTSLDFFGTQLWTPLTWNATTLNRNFHSISFAVARLTRGASLGTARAEMDTIAERISRDHPDTNKGWGAIVRPYSDLWVTDDFKRSLYLLLAAVAAVLLIACANLSHVTLARGLAREREVALRSALGASRRRLVQQLLVETVVVALIGGVLGVGLGHLLLRVLVTSIAAYEIPSDVPIAIDRGVLFFTMALSVTCGIAFGVVPAFSATRVSPGASLKGDGRTASVSRAGRRWRRALIVNEVALAFVLLSSAGLLIQSFYRMQRADPGFMAANVLTAGLPVADSQFSSRTEMNAYLQRVMSRVQSLPGVTSAALTDALPMHWPPYATFFEIAGHPGVDRANRPLCDFKTVSPSYFPTVGLVLRRGRLLTADDRQGSPLAAIVNESMVRKFFAREDPLGKRLIMRQIVPGSVGQFGPDVSWQIVGIIADERMTSFDDPTEHPAMYVSYEQSPTPFQQLVVRAAVDVAPLHEPLRKALAEIDRNQVLSDVKTLDEVLAETMSPDRLRTRLIGTFALVAIFLSGIGVYGVIAFSVGQRTRELGIRKALGASVANLQWLVARDVVTLAGAGLLVGIGCTFGASRLLSGFLFGVGATDPVTLAAAAVSIAGLAALAAYVPSRRVVRVDPMIALRAE
jgi:putative ABC transport system permease protein